VISILIYRFKVLSFFLFVTYLPVTLLPDFFTCDFITYIRLPTTAIHHSTLVSQPPPLSPQWWCPVGIQTGAGMLPGQMFALVSNSYTTSLVVIHHWSPDTDHQ